MSQYPKPCRWSSPKYEKFVRSLPCCMCGDESATVHHLKGVGHMSGVGAKAPSYASMPLCKKCHDIMHRNPGLWGMQWEFIARTIGRAIEEGVLNLK